MFQAPWIGSTDDMKLRLDFFINGDAGYINNKFVDYTNHPFHDMLEATKKDSKYQFKENFISYSYTGETMVTEDEDVLVTGTRPKDKIVVTYTLVNLELTEDGKLKSERVTCRKIGEIVELPRDQVDYIDVSPKELVSIATTLIPFIENDNATRAMLASNMQRQAVPLMITDSPIVGTGIEYRAAKDSGIMILAQSDGTIKKVTGDEIILEKAKDAEVASINEKIKELEKQIVAIIGE